MCFTESKRKLSSSTLSGLVLPDPTVHNPVIQIPSHRSSLTSINLFVTTISQHYICSWLQHKDRVPHFLWPLRSLFSSLKGWPQGDNFLFPCLMYSHPCLAQFISPMTPSLLPRVSYLLFPSLISHGTVYFYHVVWWLLVYLPLHPLSKTTYLSLYSFYLPKTCQTVRNTRCSNIC